MGAVVKGGMGGRTAVKEPDGGEDIGAVAFCCAAGPAGNHARAQGEVPRRADGDTLEDKRADTGEGEDNEEAWVVVSSAVVYCRAVLASAATGGQVGDGRRGASRTDRAEDDSLVHRPLDNAEQEQPHGDLDETDPRDDEDAAEEADLDNRDHVFRVQRVVAVPAHAVLDLQDHAGEHRYAERLRGSSVPPTKRKRDDPHHRTHLRSKHHIIIPPHRLRHEHPHIHPQQHDQHPEAHQEPRHRQDLRAIVLRVVRRRAAMGLAHEEVRADVHRGRRGASKAAGAGGGGTRSPSGAVYRRRRRRRATQGPPAIIAAQASVSPLSPSYRPNAHSAVPTLPIAPHPSSIPFAAQRLARARRAVQRRQDVADISLAGLTFPFSFPAIVSFLNQQCKSVARRTSTAPYTQSASPPAPLVRVGPELQSRFARAGAGGC